MFGGTEIHPWVVHFPIALATVGALSSVVYAAHRREWIRWFAPVLLSLALLGAAGAYFSGQSAHDRAEALGVPGQPLEQHRDWGIWGLGLTGLACFLAWATHGQRRGIWLSTLVALAAAGVILWSGHLGGKLVYEYGAGRVGGARVNTAPAR